jgi:hypothetical protein
LSLLVAILLAVQAPLDEGTLVVRADTEEIARESFRVGTLRAGPGGPGWAVAASARFNRVHPNLVLAPILELASDSQPASLEFDVADPRRPLRILGQLSRSRFTVRLLGRGTEQAREYPVLGRAVVLDDSVFALYAVAAWVARRAPADVTAIFPRAGRRETITIEDLGTGQTVVNRDPATLRHVRITGGANELVDIWVDDGGRLFKIEIPSKKLRVDRLPPA